MEFIERMGIGRDGIISTYRHSPEPLAKFKISLGLAALLNLDPFGSYHWAYITGSIFKFVKDHKLQDPVDCEFVLTGRNPFSASLFGGKRLTYPELQLELRKHVLLRK